MIQQPFIKTWNLTHKIKKSIFIVNRIGFTVWLVLHRFWFLRSRNNTTEKPKQQ